jgi:hypothetical protein
MLAAPPSRFFVAFAPVRALLLCANHLFVAANGRRSFIVLQAQLQGPAGA